MSTEVVTEEDVREEVKRFFRARGQDLAEMIIGWLPGNEAWVFEARYSDAGEMSGRRVVSVGTRAFGLPVRNGPGVGMKIEEMTVRSSLNFAGRGWVKMAVPAYAPLTSLETEDLVQLMRQLAEFDRREQETPRSALAI